MTSRRARICSFGLLVAFAFLAELASANFGQVNRGDVILYKDVETLVAYSPLPAHRDNIFGAAMSSQASWTPIGEDYSRSPMAEPVFALVEPATSITTGKLRALIINIESANGAATSRDGTLAPYLEGAERLRLMSRGMMEIQVDFYGKNVVVPVSDCSAASETLIQNTAEQQAKSELDLDVYRFISFVMPDIGCNYSGKANMPGRRTWLVGKWIHPGIVTHEWGHNLSLDHLNAMRCSVNNVPIQFASRDLRGQGACVHGEMHAVHSTMGSGVPNSITYRERYQLGWMRRDEAKAVVEGTYTLQSDGAPAMLWMQNVEGDQFIAEFFKNPYAVGSDMWDGYTQTWIPSRFFGGVLVHYVSKLFVDKQNGSGYGITSNVLDMNPATGTMTDATLQSGQSFVDGTATIRIDVVAMTESSATVKVRGIPFRPNAPTTGIVVIPQSALGIVDVNWVPVVVVSPVTHYELQISAKSDFPVGATTSIGILGVSVTTAIPGAAYGTTYYLRLAAVNAGGRGEFGATSTAQWDKPTATKKSTKKLTKKKSGK